MKIHIFIFFIFTQILYSQFPVNLLADEISDSMVFEVSQDSEFLLTITASTNTNWSLNNSESSTLVVSIDGEWENYNQDIVLYAGNTNHDYYVSLGYLDQGEHTIEFKFDYNKSSMGAENINIESANIVDIESIDMDPDILLHSPILYGRDLLSWNESTHTDIPIIMSHYVSDYGCNKTIEYHIIFSNEDSRVGLGLADLMFNYGRTTDIEWIYRVDLDCDGEIINEEFQGASHTTTDFLGNKIGKHPILKNATLNCNFTDIGTSNYKFFLVPVEQQAYGTRQILMDEHPWSYRIMGEELINENRYEETPNPGTLNMSDVRNYIYIEYEGSDSFSNFNISFGISFFNDCQQYFNNHQIDEFSSTYANGVHRTSIELPENFNPDYIESLELISSGNTDYNIWIDIHQFFSLDNEYNLVDIPITSESINISNINPVSRLYTFNSSNLDCFSEENGSAECDDCSICNGGNSDIDDCGICFGNNVNIDCAGICFGNSEVDVCGICDENLNNNNLTCSGCTDINANNFDENAVFYDESCIYSDNLFFVPNEYNSIQNAIFFASNGDTIEVGDGTYQENINFLEKSITLRSQPDISISPIIQGVDSLSTITIENSIDASISGFTIRNGYGTGVSFDDFISLAADPIAFDSLVTNVLRGGGLSIINSNVNLDNLNINNNISRNVGAGISLINSHVIINSTEVSNNIIPDGDALGGGGIAINGGTAIFNDVNISNNLVGSNMYYLNGGGGILCGFSFGEAPLEIYMYNTTIFNNIANIGAGIGALSGNIYIERTLIANNTGDFGSAISMGEPLGLIVDNISMDIINSTITNNSGIMTTGLINSSYLNILNSIFFNNDSDYEFAAMPNNNQLNIEGVYSLFENNFDGEGNIISDPLFQNIDSNYQLSEDSPCIDTGTNYFDFNNGSSIQIDSYIGSAPDIGAYEFNSSIQDCQTSLGDINLDGILDILDILQTVNMIMGFVETSEEQICLADINEDNILDIFDIIIMINFILEN